ncbi:MAG: TRAP transporter TatT component family protein [Acidobacteriota bacterium]|nr:TRAP transporter TatT component family protein [Acidobacteriota bacterium]MDH3529757.1 TRAP transporter TatT component family protein [Acidobacteriota bacterium]
MKILVLIVLLFAFALVFTGCGPQSVAEAEPAAAKPAASEALEKSAALFAKRIELENARKALKTLAAARDPEKRDFTVEWTFARYSYFVGSRKEIDDTEAEKILSTGISAARIARRLKPDRPEGHFWFAAILGEQSKRSPVTVGVISTGKIRESMEKVIEIDPRYQGASAYDALGQVEMGTRGMAGGSVEKAIGYFRKALETDNENSYTHLHIGEAYLAAGQKAEARKHLEYVLNMKTHPDFQAEHAESKKDAQKLLDTKF